MWTDFTPYCSILAPISGEIAPPNMQIVRVMANGMETKLNPSQLVVVCVVPYQK